MKGIFGIVATRIGALPQKVRKFYNSTYKYIDVKKLNDQQRYAIVTLQHDKLYTEMLALKNSAKELLRDADVSSKCIEDFVGTNWNELKTQEGCRKLMRKLNNRIAAAHQ